MEFQESKRIKKLGAYLFARIDEMKARLKAQGKDVIDLGVGDPDIPTDKVIQDALIESLKDSENHRYPSYTGMLAFRQAVASFMKRRFNVSFSPEKEIMSLLGSKEGIAHFPFAFVDEGDVVLCPDPAYPVYSAGTMFAGGEPYLMPLLQENNFLPDLKSIPKDILKRAKVIWVNYPNNPTSAEASIDFFKELVAFAKLDNIIVCHDCAYSELYFGKKPISVFNVPEAKELAIEFHSLSKTFNMTGWRVGFAVGHERLIRGLTAIKTNIDSGVFQSIQYAAIKALENYETLNAKVNKVYAARRALVTEALRNMGYFAHSSEATFYVWVKVPKGYTSESFVARLLEEIYLITTPGNGFGKHGEGYFRLALNQTEERLKEAMDRLLTIKV